MDVIHAILGALTAVIGGLLLVAALLLLVPIRFWATGTYTTARVDAQGGASWGPGVATALASAHDGVQVRLFGLRVYRRHGPDEPRPAKERRQKAKKPRRPGGWRPGPRYLWRVARRLIPSLRLHARVLGRFGTGDPAATGRLYGWLAAVRSILPAIDTHDLRIEWTEPAVDLEAEVDGRLWPAAIMWIVASEYVRARWPHRAEEVR